MQNLFKFKPFSRFVRSQPEERCLGFEYTTKDGLKAKAKHTRRANLCVGCRVWVVTRGGFHAYGAVESFGVSEPNKFLMIVVKFHDREEVKGYFSSEVFPTWGEEPMS